MKNKNRMLRFNVSERLAHWVHAISFTLLLITGSALIFSAFGRLLGTQGLRTAGAVHRVMAYPFSFLTAAILLLATPRSALQWLRSIVTWSKNDLQFLAAFPKEFFGLKPKLPPQGKFNAGEKVNSLLTIIGSLLMMITGWIMVYRDQFSAATLGLVYPLHDLGALIMGAVIIGHAYLGLLHPGSREALNGMISGIVSERFAREHHALWYEETRANGD